MEPFDKDGPVDANIREDFHQGARDCGLVLSVAFGRQPLLKDAAKTKALLGHFIEVSGVQQA
jgi:hypothetical protein